MLVNSATSVLLLLVLAVFCFGVDAAPKSKSGIKIKFPKSRHSSYHYGAAQQDPQNQFVFCGINGQTVAKGQQYEFYARPSGKTYTPGMIVNAASQNTKVGFVSAQNAFNVASAQNALIPGSNISITENNKPLTRISITGMIQNAFLGYGCVNGQPGDYAQWFKVSVKVPDNLTPGQYALGISLEMNLGGETLGAYSGFSQNTISIQ